MKDMIKVTLSLVIIFIAAGLIMGLTYMQTSPVRFVAEKKEHEEALKLMAPEAKDPIHTAGSWTTRDGKSCRYYNATTGGTAVAYIADTLGKGYSSFIQMMVSIDTDLKIKDVNILHHGETPGLGDQVEDRALFLDQFKGRDVTQLELVKGEPKPGKITAITGATISSRAVTNGVQDAVKKLVDMYGAGIKKAAAGHFAANEVKYEHN